MKFSLKFANFDVGAPIVFEIDSTATIADLKQQVLKNWPQRYEAAPLSIGPLRVVCMGKLLAEADERKSIDSSGLPKMDFPTPLHISVRPAAGKALVTRPVEGKGTEPASTPCCVVS